MVEGAGIRIQNGPPADQSRAVVRGSDWTQVLRTAAEETAIARCSLLLHRDGHLNGIVWRQATVFNENPSRATVNGLGTLDGATGAASLRVSTLRPAWGPTATRYLIGAARSASSASRASRSSQGYSGSRINSPSRSRQRSSFTPAVVRALTSIVRQGYQWAALDEPSRDSTTHRLRGPTSALEETP